MPRRTVLDAYREVWLADFGFSAPPGERPSAVCLAAREVRSGLTIRLGQGELRRRIGPPYPTDRGTLFVAFDASASLGCHLAMGWLLPARVLDLKAEFRNRTNGIATPHGSGLYGALSWHGLDAVAGADRPSLDALATRGGPWTGREQEKLLDRSMGRVGALAELLDSMLPDLDLDRAILRGRYMAAVARMEYAGVPIDVPTLSRLREGWKRLQGDLIREVDSRFGVYDGRTFRPDRWEAFLAGKGFAWPRTPGGALALDDDTFKEMARSHPDVALMRELRTSLGQLRLDDLARRIGRAEPDEPPALRLEDGAESAVELALHLRPVVLAPRPHQAGAGPRHRLCRLGPAGIRHRGGALGRRGNDGRLPIGRPLSRVRQAGRPDSRPRHEADPQGRAGAVQGVRPRRALRDGCGGSGTTDRPAHRRRPRIAPLSPRGLPIVLEVVRRDGARGDALGGASKPSSDGPSASVRTSTPDHSATSHARRTGPRCCRLACCLATERGVSVVAPVHDALLIEGPARSIDEIVRATQEAMAEASEIVLDGFRLRSEARVVRWPDRYMDDRGREFWSRVMGLLPGVAEASLLHPFSASREIRKSGVPTRPFLIPNPPIFDRTPAHF